MKLRSGDFFSIDISENDYCMGQILQYSKASIYIVVFDGVYNKPVNKDCITDEIFRKPAIISRTGDTYFQLKRWIVIENRDVYDSNEYYPNYKIETLDGVFVTTFDRQLIRKASKEEEIFYQFYSYKSPAYVVSAIKAYHGLIAMDNDYKKLTYEFISKRANSMN